MMVDIGFYAFLQERIARGAMDPIAISRASRAFRHLPRHLAIRIGKFYPPAPASKIGPLRCHPVPLALANAFVTQYHRHLGATVGHLWSVGVSDDVGLRGVAIVGRPVARRLDDRCTVEVLRVATDGTRNACSKLHGAVRKEVLRRGYARVITYTLPEEGGASLRAAAFVLDGPAGGGRWSRAGRSRGDVHPLTRKWRWSWGHTVGPRKGL